MPKKIDLTGQKYGRLTVISEAGYLQGRCAWLCRCECGNTVTVSAHALRQGNTSSCGCLKSDTVIARNRRHDGCGSRVYKIWSIMKQRCFNRNNPKFYRYGGRGITICEEWLDFSAFQSWALSHGYADDLTIDRIDNDGNYSPDNCRWATPTQQARNTRRNVMYEGKTIAEWGPYIPVTANRVCQRIHAGWPIEKALFTPKLH